MKFIAALVLLPALFATQTVMARDFPVTRAKVENLRLDQQGRSVRRDDGKGSIAGARSFRSPLSIADPFDIFTPLLVGDSAIAVVPPE